MAKKATKKKAAPARPQLGDNVEILSAGEVIESPITDTLETNYMPYAMSVIVSRALPEIDGFKPAHFFCYLICWEGEKFFRRDAFGQCVLLTRRRNAPAN